MPAANVAAKKSDQKLTERQAKIAARKGLVGCGSAFTAALQAGGTVSITGDNRWQQIGCTAWNNIISVACGHDIVIGIRSDGTVVGAGKDARTALDVSRLFCIRAVSCGLHHIGAITQDGRAICISRDSLEQGDVLPWTNIVDICCGDTFTAGLTAHGTVLLNGGSATMRRIVEQWTQIAGLFTDHSRRTLYAIDRDGRLLSSRPLPYYATAWKNLVYVTSNGTSLYGINTKGEILSEHHSHTLHQLRRASEQLPAGGSASTWIACESGPHFLAALRRDGRVICVGRNDLGQTQTTDFDPCFSDFSSYCVQRDKLYQYQQNANHHYQCRLALAMRFKKWIACGKHVTAARHVGGHMITTGNFQSVKSWNAVSRISCGNAHLLALLTDGTVCADGNDVDGCCRVEDWRDIRSVQAVSYHSLGLTMAGTVLFSGQNDYGQGDVLNWSHIKSICGNDFFTVGLNFDGRLVATRIREDAASSVLTQEDIRHWNDCLDEIQTSPLWQQICQVSVSDHHIAALRKNGTVVTIGDRTYNQVCPRTSAALTVELPWSLIRSIATGSGYTVGLYYGGSVVACGVNHVGQCNTEDWSHIVDVDCGYEHTVGLHADGRVITCGLQKVGKTAILDTNTLLPAGYTPCKTREWQHIVAVRCGAHHTVAISDDGHLLACGQNADGQCDISSVALFHNIDKVYPKHTSASSEPS